jgi:quercetin 2,3-dioxygenase
MTQIRSVQILSTSQPTLEGAGVHLRRAFGFHNPKAFDPFLLLDDFRSNDPALYLKGFPWHPHRGIETITYMLEGEVEHGDSLGNQGVIHPGEVQWMTAGSGIIHQEMPKGDAQGRMGGFQLWANLPAAQKMMPPRYRDLTREQIPLVSLENGVQVRVICGEAEGVRGPVEDIVIQPQYLDVSLPANTAFNHPTRPQDTVFAYVIEGIGQTAGEKRLERHNLALFDAGDLVSFESPGEGMRFLLISGQPLGEPIAWRGPIVMNTSEELETAFSDLRQGTFIK